ncbi:hypothetical protein AM487_005885 [Pseudomonas aeruginosa]|nr:hypothetical protein PSA83_05866 [Pseudomonas aeruginosa]OKO18606.1 hypothetical protein AM487_005885 [Pseudomonas aeruginosa]SCY62511.1 Uncharacterised protein [Acinetobacter baumannii]SPY92957.1 Uncharacterised protein [Pseudomonas aeruginosa]
MRATPCSGAPFTGTASSLRASLVDNPGRRKPPHSDYQVLPLTEN